MDLDRAATVELFVTAVNDFLLFDGAVERPSDDTLSFDFAEPLGFVRLLGCACCFVLWMSERQAKSQALIGSPFFSEVDAPLVSECSLQDHERTRLHREKRLRLFLI